MIAAISLVLMLMPVIAAGQGADIVIERQRERFSPDAPPYGKPPQWYAARVKAKIAERWYPPETSVPNLIAVLTIVITPEGLVTEEITRPSGSLAFDAAAVRAVHEAAPFPPLPTEHRAQRARLIIEFR
jgi:TolA protein